MKAGLKYTIETYHTSM